MLYGFFSISVNVNVNVSKKEKREGKIVKGEI